MIFSLFKGIKLKRVLGISLVSIVFCFFGAVTIASANNGIEGNITISEEWQEKSLSTPGRGFYQAILPPATVDGGTLDRAPQNLITSSDILQDGSELKVAQLATDAPSAPASIIELARALKHDPDLIYEFVHDNIKYYPIWGVQKGALGALIDGEGTAFDQAALMVELLRVSGYTASYQKGTIEISGEQARIWFGYDNTQACPIFNLISRGQVPIKSAIASLGGECPLVSDLIRMQIGHVWVKVNIDNTDYLFDPSFKELAISNGINLAAVSGYNAGSYLAAAKSGATLNANYVQNLNRNNIRNNLSNYTNNLISYIRHNAPDADLKDIIGGNSIKPLGNIPALRQTTLPYQVALDNEWPGEIPDSYRPTLNIQYQGINKPLYSDDIYGKRLTIFFNTSNQPELRLDGALIATGNSATPGSVTTVTFDVKHNAYASTGINQQFSQDIQAGGSYLISNGWGPVNRPMLDHHQALLNTNLDAGHSDTSEAVLGESLSTIAYAWLAEITAASNLSGQITDTITLYHH